jgi:hypothetical protein
MPDISTGWQMIQMAAEVATLTLESHWAKTWLKIDANRIGSARSDRGRKLAVDQLFRDTESVIDHIWKQLA